MKAFLSVALIISVLFFSILIGACGDDDDSSGSSSDDDVDINDDLNDDTQDDDGNDGANDDADDDDSDDDVNDDADDDTQECVDEDGDSYGDNCPAGPDCDDTDPFIHPGAAELPDDGIDQNCDDVDLIPSDETGVFIATTGDDANPGTMAEPKLTINAGASLALQAGKSVFIAAGEYTEDVITEVSLFGGYESTEWTRDIESNVTTINAQANVAVKACESPGRDDEIDGDWLRVKASETNPIAIQGFTIKGGWNTTNEQNNFGVVNCNTMIIVDNTINGGSGGGENVGVINSGTLKLENNNINGGSRCEESTGVRNEGLATLVGNKIDGGSGSTSSGVNSLCNWEYFTFITLINNTIYGGSGGFVSYGVYSTGAALLNNVIDGGSGGNSFGVAMVTELEGGMLLMKNNVIKGGSASGFSVGLFDDHGSMEMVNNVIDGGSGSSGRAGMLVWTPAGISLKNNNIWGAEMRCIISFGLIPLECVATTIDEVNACTWQGCDESSANINVDSLFVDPDGGDYHLQSSSPCIDAGINPTPDYFLNGFVDFDFDGEPRPYGAGWDIGPDEWRPGANDE